MIKRIGRTPFKKLTFINNCTFGPLNKPVATVKPGETIAVDTWDAIGGVVKRGQTRKDVLEKGTRIYKNPITGPIFIEDAEPGDVLIVEMLDISLPEIGETSVMPGSGGLEGWLQLSPSLTKFSRIAKGKVIYETASRGKIEIPVKPFVGTIGVSPESEAVSTIIPGKHGGNMDVPDVCVGNKLYLPVAVKGALFGLGDVHAVQGDGEICGTAVEIPSTVKMKFGLLKNKKLDWPRVESPEELMTVSSAKPLEDAVRLAFLELVKLLQEDYGFERYDAYMFLSLTAKVRVAQIVDPLFTAVAKISKQLLPKQASRLRR